MVGTYRRLAASRYAPHLRGWIHGDTKGVSAPHVMVPFWYSSLVVRRQWSGAGKVIDVRMRLHGPQPTTYLHQEDTGVELIGVEIAPEAGTAVQGIHQADYASLRIDWENAAFSNVLKHAESGAPAMDVAAMLANRIAQLTKTIEISPAARAVRLLRRTKGRLSLSDLPEKLSISERSLRAGFKSLIGLSAKNYARLVRLNALISAADHCNHPNWAQLALEYGHYDQAHMVNDVKQMTGLTPAKLHDHRRAESFASTAQIFTKVTG